MSHGYEVEATPLQILLAYAALANGGTLLRPYIVAEERDVYGLTIWKRTPETIRNVIKKSTAQTLLPAFERVVTDGTGTLAAVEGLRIAGKTGTAQKAQNGSYARGKYRATFTGFFPADDPQVALIVVLDEPEKSPYGGIVAAPIFSRIASRWAGTMSGLAPNQLPEQRTRDTSYVSVPELRKQPVGIAMSRLAVRGLDIADGRRPSNPFAVVAEQIPAQGTDVPPATAVRVNLSMSSSPSPIPDLRGLSCRHAVSILVARGTDVRVEGHGRVIRVRSGSGTAVTVDCR
jgi:cell division protein FtsI (penicillin-binding protein 3)